MSSRQGLSRRLRAIGDASPGTVTVSLSVHESADAFVRSPSTGKPAGHRLRDLRARADGGKITVTDPYRGEAHTLSIDHLSGFDPDRTYVVIHYRFTPDDPIAHTRIVRQLEAEGRG